MNKAMLIGRLTKKPEIKYTSDAIAHVGFTLAVNTRKDKSDFINCVAWRNTAELIGKYFDKGSQIGIEGFINTRDYEKEGRKIYITEVIVERITFLDSKKADNGETTSAQQDEVEETDPFKDFANQVFIDDDDLPF